MTTPINSFDNLIDSRNILARIKALEAITDEDDCSIELDSLCDVIIELNDNASEKPDDGITLIRESYFKDYARAAGQLQEDYTEIEFDGVTYYYLNS